VDPCGALLVARGGHNAVQLPAGAANVDAGSHGRAEVAFRGVQPGEQGCLDARGPQCQGLGDVRDSQPGGACFEGSPRHRNRAVPVGVGLHHGHDLGGRGGVGQPAHVMPDGVQVDHGGPLVLGIRS
jgi:hypothetical protein